MPRSGWLARQLTRRLPAEKSLLQVPKPSAFRVAAWSNCNSHFVYNRVLNRYTSNAIIHACSRLMQPTRFVMQVSAAAWQACSVVSSRRQTRISTAGVQRAYVYKPALYSPHCKPSSLPRKSLAACLLRAVEVQRLVLFSSAFHVRSRVPSVDARVDASVRKAP